jgi:hypothetical protein
VSELVVYPGECETAIHRGILHRRRYSVHGNRLGSPWYEATNSGQEEGVHPGQAREPDWSAECWHVELAVLVFAETKRLWLMSVISGVGPARLWSATS